MKILLILIVTVILPAHSYADAPVFRLNSGAPESLSNATGDAFYNRIANEIFRRLNRKLSYIRHPSARSLIQANKGIDDGNIARIEGMEKKWPNLVRVPESVIIWEFTAYSHNDNIKIYSWDSLKPYSLGFVRGWQIYDKKSAGAKKVIKANNPVHLLELLKNGRIDIALFERLQSSYWFRKANYSPKQLAPSLAKKPLYIYLHKKHKDLVPEMSKVIREMKEDGTYQVIFDRAFNTTE